MATRPDPSEPAPACTSPQQLCFAEALRAANRSINRLYARHLDGMDITPGQTAILTRLYYAGEITMAELAEQMGTERTTMVRNVAPLEATGHILQRPADQGRAHLYRLSDTGMAALRTALPHWQAAQDALRAELGDALWESLLDGLRRLAEIDSGVR